MWAEMICSCFSVSFFQEKSVIRKRYKESISLKWSTDHFQLFFFIIKKQYSKKSFVNVY